MLAAACSPSEDKADTGHVKLYVFDCGRIDSVNLGMFSSDGSYEGRAHSMADMCFLVRHPEGDLMWDSGLPDSLNETEGGVFVEAYSLNIAVPNTLESQLEATGVSPDEIEYYTLSHSHFDHLGNTALFAGSTFLVDKNERAYMFRDEARADEQAFPLYAMLENAETVEFEGDHDVFGDGSVMIIATPGHTPGHKSLLVRLENTGVVMITGDLYHLIESREKRIAPAFNHDIPQTLASMDHFEAIADENNATVIVEHALEHYEKLPHAPEYLD